MNESWTDMQSQVFSTTHIGKTETRAKSRVFEAVRNRCRSQVLDVGCGDGGIVAALVAAGVNARGVDLPDVVAVARTRHPGINFVGEDVMKVKPVSIPDYDTALSMDVIEHMENDLGFLKRLGEIAPQVIITTPSNPEKFREQQQHLRYYIPVTMARLLAIAGMVMTEHVRIYEEDTNLFVAERSALPLGERLALSVAAANEPPTSMHLRVRMVDEVAGQIAQTMTCGPPNWNAPVWLAAYAAMGDMFIGAGLKVGLHGSSAAIIGACGGAVAEAMLGHGFEALLIDNDLGALAEARANIGENKLARYVLSDPCSAALENATIAVCHNLDHAPDPLAVVRSVRDTIVSGGLAAFITDHPSTKVPGVVPGETPRLLALLTFGGPAYSFGRLRTYSEEELKTTVGAFMEAVSSQVVTGLDLEGREHALTVVVARRRP